MTLRGIEDSSFSDTLVVPATEGVVAEVTDEVIFEVILSDEAEANVGLSESDVVTSC